MILTLKVVLQVLAVVVARMIVQGVLVEVDFLGVVSDSSSGGFVVVVLKGFGLVL